MVGVGVGTNPVGLTVLMVLFILTHPRRRAVPTQRRTPPGHGTYRSNERAITNRCTWLVPS